jgi:hypothetical protein
MLPRVMDTSGWWQAVVNTVPQVERRAVTHGSLSKAVRRWYVKLEKDC